MSNPLLSICIPTFNRPDFIKIQLNEILPLLQKYKVLVYISDNSDNLETQEVVEAFNSDLIRYNRNEINIHDRNFLKVIQLPETEYRWLLSDSTNFQEDLLKSILEKCQQNTYDYIFLNSGRVKDIANNRIYEDSNQLLSDLGWHLTHISSIIYSKKILIKTYLIDRYLDTNFIHHALVFEPWINYVSSAIWINSPIYYNNGLIKHNTWSKLVFEIWAKRWPDYVLSLPPTYKLPSKLNCIKNHNNNTKLFSIKHLLSYYAKNYINKKEFQRFSIHIDISLTKREKIYLKIILNIPQWLLKRLNDMIFQN